MNRRCIAVFLVFLMLSCSVCTGIVFANDTQDINQSSQSIPSPEFELCLNCGDFVAENITFNDSCFKGTDVLHPCEWWYFDAVFENNYSVEFDISLFSTKYFGVVVPILNIYKNGAIIKHDLKVLPVKKFFASKEHPFIALEGKQIMDGYVSASGAWIFNLSLGLDEYSVDLQFESVTTGWKARILDMWQWGVILPKAIVRGTLHLHNETIPVIGTGYMEHAWDGKIPIVWGWYWGKFVSKTYNIIWTDIIKNRNNEYIMMVLNQDDGDYYNIEADKIQYSLSNYSNNDGWKIPTSFSFKVEDDSIKIDISVETISIDHQISFGTFNYWRYHVLVEGTITYNGTTEYMHNIQIMDLTRFR